MARQIKVDIVGDSRSLERAFQRSSRAGRTWAQEMTQVLGGGRGGALGGVALARGGPVAAGALAAGATFIKTTQLASNLNEEISRSGVVFGQSAGDIQAWSQTTADSFGIAQTEALQAADNFGTMFSTIGLGQEEAAAMSKRLVELAADLASFNNQDPSEMLDRLRSGLAGEAEPLRRFGILLSEARVQQEAYATGIAKAGQKLTEQQKVAARYSLILKDTKLAQGDFARTSENLANQQRKLKAQTTELATRIGTKLLPAMTGIVSGANDGIDALDRLGDAMDRAGSKSTGLAGAFGALKEGLSGLAGTAFGGISGGFRGAALGGKSPFQPRPSLGVGEGAASVREAAELAAKEAKAAAKAARGTAEQRNRWFDEMIGRREDRVQDIRSLQGQIAEYRRIAALIEARIRITKDVTRRLNLEDELLDVRRRIRATEEASRAQSQALAEERKALAEERREREKLARENAQFAALGLGPGGAAPVPGVAALRKRLGRVQDAIQGTALDTKAWRKKLDAIRAVIAKWGTDLTEDVRRAIEQTLAAADEKLGEQPRRRRMAFRAVNPAEILRGLGLSPEQMRILTARLAGVSGGKVPSGGPAAFGMPLAGGTVVNVYGDVVTPNPDAFARTMQKRAARSRPQQRGVRPGVNTGLA